MLSQELTPQHDRRDLSVLQGAWLEVARDFPDLVRQQRRLPQVLFLLTQGDHFRWWWDGRGVDVTHSGIACPSSTTIVTMAWKAISFDHPIFKYGSYFFNSAV